MDFTLSEEQRLIVDTVRAFVEKELYPHEDEVERLDEVPPELAGQIRAKAIAAGLYAANMPAELGGGGLDAVSLVLAGELHQRINSIFPCELPSCISRRPSPARSIGISQPMWG